MAVFKDTNTKTFKDIKASKTFVDGASDVVATKKRGRAKITNKRDKSYTFYCTQAELDELQARADAKHLTLAEYFRVKLFFSEA